MYSGVSGALLLKFLLAMHVCSVCEGGEGEILERSHGNGREWEFCSTYKFLLYMVMTAPSYLFEELCQPADFEARRRLRSASSSSLVVRRTRLSTVGDRAFPVAAARIWNGLPPHVTSARCTLAACFSQSSEDASLQTLLSVTPSSVFCRACEVTRHNRTR